MKELYFTRTLRHLLLTAACFIVALCSRADDNAPTLSVGKTAPTILAADTLGANHSLQELRGTYVIVDFWASWCGDCRREIPALITLEKEFRNQKIKGHRVTWLSVSFDHDNAAWKQALRRYNMPWTHISNGVKWKENPVAKSYDLHWIPTFYVVDPKGRIAGGAITAEELRQLLLKLQGKGK